jgi:hypothetical protein
MPLGSKQDSDDDRRTGEDRRRVDNGPPGKHERRRSLEPRKPEVVELDMSNSEWSALSDDPAPPKLPKE